MPLSKYLRRQETKESEGSDAFTEVEHKHENPVVSLDYASINKSTIYVTMHKRKAPINMLSCSKAPKTQQMEHCQHSRKASVFFFSFHQPVHNFSTHKIFVYFGSFVKVSVPVYLPYLNQGIVYLKIYNSLLE